MNACLDNIIINLDFAPKIHAQYITEYENLNIPRVVEINEHYKIWEPYVKDEKWKIQEEKNKEEEDDKTSDTEL